MSFSKDVKARMFVRCARICPLCYKQCGTNMEAAHIVAEADGGSDTDDNGIPLCLDCHQEIGAYDDRHPRGNKFTPFELRSRRDQLYALVDSGSIQAQIIADRIHNRLKPGSPSLETADVTNAIRAESYQPSREAKSVLSQARTDWNAPYFLARKLQLLSERDRAYVLDELLNSFEDELALKALIGAITNDAAGQETTVVAEQLIRQLTLLGSVAAKARVMDVLPAAKLGAIDAGLRSAFFDDIIDIMYHDQFVEVNLITPAVTKVQEAIPPELYGRYMKALFLQAESGAFQGAPAARRALAMLPNELVQAGLEALDDSALRLFRGEHVRTFLRNNRTKWPADRESIFEDFTTMNYIEFWRKHWKD